MNYKKTLSYILKILILTSVLSSCGFHLVIENPELKSAEICNNKDCKAKLTGKSPVSIKLEFNKAPFGTRVKTVWYYIDKNTKKLIRERISDIDKPVVLFHRVRVPKAGFWKAGNYEIIVFLNGKQVKTVNFSIPKQPKPKKEKTEKNKKEKPAEKDMLDDDF